MSSQYGELGPTNCWDLFGSLEHPSKFQRVLWLGFVTAALSLIGGKIKLCTMFGHLQGWCTIYTFWGLLPPAQHSSSAHEPNFVAWYKEWNYFRATYIQLGGHHIGHRPTFQLVMQYCTKLYANSVPCGCQPTGNQLRMWVCQFVLPSTLTTAIYYYYVAWNLIFILSSHRPLWPAMGMNQQQKDLSIDLRAPKSTNTISITRHQLL